MSPSRGPFMNLRSPAFILCVLCIMKSSYEKTTDIPDTCGKTFVIPLLTETRDCAVDLEVIPQTLSKTVITITAPSVDRNFSRTFEIMVNVSLKIPLDFTLPPGTEKPKALLLSSAPAVSVLLGREKGDRCLLLSTDVFGQVYQLVAAPDNRTSLVTLVSEDFRSNTTVSFSAGDGRSLCALLGRAAADCGENETEAAFTLQGLDALVLAADRLGGVQIRSSKPIGAYLITDSGQSPLCANSTEVTWEMLPPLSTWGKTFVAFPLNSNQTMTLVISGRGNLTVREEGESRFYDIEGKGILELNFTTGSHVLLWSARPALVLYITYVASPDGGRPYRNDFILPPLEQYDGCQSFAVGDPPGGSILVAVASSAGGAGWVSDKLDSSSENVAKEASESSGKNATTVVRARGLSAGYHFVSNENAPGCLGMFLYDAERRSVNINGVRLTGMRSSLAVGRSGGDEGCSDVADERPAQEKGGKDELLEKNADQPKRLIKKRTPRLSVVEEQEEENPRSESLGSNLLAVIVSLSVALFAVCAVIFVFVFLELLARRKQLRNTKIRPFVS